MKRNRDLAPKARAVVNSSHTHAPANMPHTMAMATRPSNEAFSADVVGLTEPRSEMKMTALAAANTTLLSFRAVSRETSRSTTRWENVGTSRRSATYPPTAATGGPGSG